MAAAINLAIGVIYGGVAGFFGGKVDRLMMSFVDILYGIPLLLYVILLMVVLIAGFNLHIYRPWYRVLAHYGAYCAQPHCDAKE